METKRVISQCFLVCRSVIAYKCTATQLLEHNMFRHLSVLFAFATLGSGCLTGNSYPEQYADAYCESLFTCVPSNQIDLATSYDSVDECVSEVSEAIRESSVFDSFQEGDSTFNKENAESCINEAAQMLTDDSCDGELDIVSFSLDATESDCSDVYETKE